MEYDTAMDMSYKVAASIEEFRESIEGDLGVVSDAIGELTTLLANIFQPESWREIFKHHQSKQVNGRTYGCTAVVRYCDQEEVCKVNWFFKCYKFDAWDNSEIEVFSIPQYSAAILRVCADIPLKLDKFIEATDPDVADYLKGDLTNETA